jgi:DNA-directed RNA polymerase subunit M/transcription elongation factor TFIIS
LIKIKDYIPCIQPQLMGKLSSEELNPLINKPYVDQLLIREQQETKVKYSTMYKCSACGERKTISYTIQTCSGDEGDTQFVKCLCCPRVWRIYG